jgi:uncharacterized protein (TIGR02646 family)
MRYIQKGHEPESLRDHRRAGGDYATYSATDDLRAALLKEQGSICCYCMQRIKLREMKIEHWAPQSVHPHLQLDYHNLLGACLGGERNAHPSQHCDTHKGSTKIKVHPADPRQRCDRLVRYRSNGEIYSDDPDVQRDLDDTLNLNTVELTRRRNGAITGLAQRLAKEKKGQWPPDLIRREVEVWRSRGDDGSFRELCQVIIYYLQKKLPAESD